MDKWSGRGGQLNHSRSSCHAKYSTAQPIGSRKVHLTGTEAWAGPTLRSSSIIMEFTLYIESINQTVAWHRRLLSRVAWQFLCVGMWPRKQDTVRSLEFGVRSSEFGVRRLEFGVWSLEFGVRRCANRGPAAFRSCRGQTPPGRAYDGGMSGEAAELVAWKDSWASAIPGRRRFV